MIQKLTKLVVILALLSTIGAFAAEPAERQLPLRRAVLFSSGVGFFEHRAEVDGNAQIDLKFNVDDINDLLKSMVLQDLGGGKISTVTYGSKDPITRTLKTFAIDLTENPTLAQLLEQVRGEQISIQAPNEIVGTIVGIETRKQRVNKDETIDVAYLNLLTSEGLRSIPLDQVTKIKIVNEKLDAELRQALTILALGHATDKKTVTLNFNGEGKRPVQVGYIQESPVWKTSYRLVLDDKKTPLLQGWAIVENTTESDWNDVQLTLVSGRPISFVMDLYEPLYVQRPKVEPESFAALRPQKYQDDLAAQDEKMKIAAARSGARGTATASMPGTTREWFALERPKVANDANGPVPASSPLLGRDANEAPDFDADGVRHSVQPNAQAGEVGELFQYAIDSPVTLERQRSAMLPIVNGPIEAEKVSIYDQNAHPKHPLNGLQLKNTTSLHLMQGPITVFDDGSYAGDAQIADLTPGGERLVSYAMDLDTEIAPESKNSPEQLTRVKLVKGTLESTRKLSRTVEYTIKNSGRADKKVLIGYPHDPSWRLIKPAKADEQTRDGYRFYVNAESGKPAKLLVEEEQVLSQQIGLSNLDDGTILYYVNSKAVSDQVKEALKEVMRRRQQLAATGAQRQQIEAQIQAIAQEQTRIRENMTRLERNTELYARYTKKLNTQEDEIEGFREQLKKLTDEVTAQQRALDEYLIGLDAT